MTRITTDDCNSRGPGAILNRLYNQALLWHVITASFLDAAHWVGAGALRLLIWPSQRMISHANNVLFYRFLHLQEQNFSHQHIFCSGIGARSSCGCGSPGCAKLCFSLEVSGIKIKHWWCVTDGQAVFDISHPKPVFRKPENFPS